MKRFIAAAALAALATSALAVEFGKPYEQVDIDRALPNLTENSASQTVYPFGGSAPYEQLSVDRALPQIVVGSRTQVAATAGATRSDVEIAADEGTAVSPWANDHNVITPAQ